MNTELDTPCIVMQITFVDKYEEQFRAGHQGRRPGSHNPRFSRF
jgi:hypothetical protein